MFGFVFAFACVLVKGELIDDWRDRNSCFWRDAIDSVLSVLTHALYTPTPPLSLCMYTDSSSRGLCPL